MNLILWPLYLHVANVVLNIVQMLSLHQTRTRHTSEVRRTAKNLNYVIQLMHLWEEMDKVTVFLCFFALTEGKYHLVTL